MENSRVTSLFEPNFPTPPLVTSTKNTIRQNSSTPTSIQNIHIIPISSYSTHTSTRLPCYSISEKKKHPSVYSPLFPPSFPLLPSRRGFRAIFNQHLSNFTMAIARSKHQSRPLSVIDRINGRTMVNQHLDDWCRLET